MPPEPWETSELGEIKGSTKLVKINHHNSFRIRFVQLPPVLPSVLGMWAVFQGPANLLEEGVIGPKLSFLIFSCFFLKHTPVCCKLLISFQSSKKVDSDSCQFIHCFSGRMDL